MERIRDLFQERELEEVAVVFPYSNDFSNRKLAYDATTRAIRACCLRDERPFLAGWANIIWKSLNHGSRS